MVRYCLFLIIGYINLLPTYAILSEYFNRFSLASYSTLRSTLVDDASVPIPILIPDEHIGEHN